MAKLLTMPNKWKDNPQLIPEGSLIRKQIELANKPSKKRPKKDVKSNETDKKPFLTWVLLLLFSLSFSSKADNICPVTLKSVYAIQ